MKHFISAVSVLFCLYTMSHTAELPPFIKPCREKDPDLVKCAIKTANEVIPIISNGIPEAGLPDLHQYKYPDAEYKNSGLAIKLSDGIAKGFDTFYIDNIKFDFVNKEQFYNATLKFIDVDGKYNIDGKLFDTPIKNTGDFNIHLDSVQFIYKLEYEIIKKDDVDYLHKKLQTIHLVPEKFKVQFHKILDDDEKSQKFNEQLNADSGRTVKEILPAVAKLFDNYIHKHVFEAMVHQVPYNKIFLQD